MASQDVPEIILEQYRLRELPAEIAARIASLLATDADLRDRLAALERSDEEIRGDYPAGWLSERIRSRRGDRAAAARPDRIRRWGLPVAFAAAATVLVFTLPTRSVTPGSGGAAVDDDHRIKGLRPSLAVYRRTESGSETLADGAVVRPGDLLRLGYLPADRLYGVILSIDRLGAVTMHLPPSGDRAARLAHERMNLLDAAYELDDAPGWERFYLVTSREAFDVRPVREAARRAASDAGATPPGALPLPSNFDQAMFLLQKEVRP